MKNPLLALALLVVALILPAGCANQGAVVVTGLRVEVTELQRAADGAVVVRWHLVNPNVSPYLLMEVKNTLYLNGSLVGTTFDADPFGVAARNQSAPKESRLETAGPAAERLVADAVGAAAVAYRVDSNVTVRILDEAKERGELSNSGTVRVVGK